MTVEIPIDLDPNTAAKAQAVIDNIDHNLDKVESIASNYWRVISKPTFWSHVQDNLNTKLDTVLQKTSNLVLTEDKKDTDGGSSTAIPVAGDRTQLELQRLNNDPAVYLDSKFTNEEISFDDQQLSTITTLLNDRTNDIVKVYNSLVPSKLTHDKFWSIYFQEKDQILIENDQRKKLIHDKSTATKLNEEDLQWDDEEEEEGEETKSQESKDDLKESVVIVNKEDVDDPPSNTTKEEKQQHEQEQEQEQDDEDDDDWE